MSFYGDMAQRAKAMIDAKGRSLTISRQAAGEYSAATDVHTPAAATTDSFKCVVLPASKGTIEAFDKRLAGQSLILENFRFVLAAAYGTSFEPKPNDTIVFDGSTWTVIGCTPLNPAGTALIYKMGVKR